jgi:hypothetical protein
MTESFRSDVSVVQRYSYALYLTAALLLLLPPLDTFFGLSNYAWTSVRWRFGAIGLITTALAVPMAGYLLGVVTATMCRHIWMQRILIAAGILIIITLTAAVGLFTLDSLQVRREVNPAALGQFNITVIKSIVTQLVQIVGFAVVTVAAVRNRERRATHHGVRHATLVSSARPSAAL